MTRFEIQTGDIHTHTNRALPSSLFPPVELFKLRGIATTITMSGLTIRKVFTYMHMHVHVQSM